MDLARFETELAQNRAAYERLRDAIRQDYAGKYVAIARGQLLGAAPTFEEASALVAQLEPGPEHFVVFPAEVEPMFEPYADTYADYQDP
jgi:hypothetical protein